MPNFHAKLVSMFSTDTAPAHQRATVRVDARAHTFGIEAQENRAILPVAALGLLVLALAAPLVAVAGLLVLLAATGLRRGALRWFAMQRAADLAERADDDRSNAIAAVLANEQNELTGQAANRMLRLPTPRAQTRSGRTLAHLCLAPRLLSTPLPALTTRAAA